jgi:hypothetical protein
MLALGVMLVAATLFAPSHLHVVSTTTKSIMIQWTGSSRASDYAVLRNGTRVAVVGRTRLSYTFTKLACSKKVSLGVRAMQRSSQKKSSVTKIVAKTQSCAQPTTNANMGATGYRALVPAPFMPNRVLTADTPAEFLADVAKLQPGDQLNVAPMTLTGEVTLRNDLDGPAEIHFAPGVRFTGSSAQGFYALWFTGVRNLRLFGGDVTNPGGGCVREDDSTNLLWWGFVLHDCGGTGLLATTVSKDASGLDFDGEITNCGLDRSLDPHAEKGTGLHAAYLGGTYRNPNLTTSGKFSLYVHDQSTGAAIQAGSSLVDTDLWLKAVNVTFDAQQQAAGSGIQFWGGDLENIVVRHATGQNLAGRMIETSGMYDCCNSNITVEYARASDTMDNPRLTGSTYDANPAVTYDDVG